MSIFFTSAVPREVLLLLVRPDEAAAVALRGRVLHAGRGPGRQRGRLHPRERQQEEVAPQKNRQRDTITGNKTDFIRKNSGTAEFIHLFQCTINGQNLIQNVKNMLNLVAQHDNFG